MINSVNYNILLQSYFLFTFSSLLHPEEPCPHNEQFMHLKPTVGCQRSFQALVASVMLCIDYQVVSQSPASLWQSLQSIASILRKVYLGLVHFALLAVFLIYSHLRLTLWSLVTALLRITCCADTALMDSQSIQQRLA